MDVLNSKICLPRNPNITMAKPTGKPNGCHQKTPWNPVIFIALGCSPLRTRPQSRCRAGGGVVGLSEGVGPAISRIVFEDVLGFVSTTVDGRNPAPVDR